MDICEARGGLFADVKFGGENVNVCFFHYKLKRLPYCVNRHSLDIMRLTDRARKGEKGIPERSMKATTVRPMICATFRATVMPT